MFQDALSRSGGPKIEAPTAGFHFVPFETIDDLSALLPALLDDAERRA